MNTLIVILISLQQALAFFPSHVKAPERPTLEEPNDDYKFDTLGVVRREDGILKVNIRSCGKLAVFPNKKGEMPQEAEAIKMETSRCHIIDWKVAK